MKYRVGFVSNSSSSSFVCVICGEEHSGMDVGLEEAEMVECDNGHIFCVEHLIKKNEQGEEVYSEYGEPITNEDDEDEDEDYGEWRYHIPPAHCPVCQFQAADDNDIMWYYLITNNLTKKEWATMIKNLHENYESFNQWLKAGRDKLNKKSKEATK